MKNYELRLFDKQNNFIDSTLIANCTNRDEALTRVKRLMMFQGLRLTNYKFTLKQTNKVKEYLED